MQVPMNKSTTHLPRESLGDSYNSVAFDFVNTNVLTSIHIAVFVALRWYGTMHADILMVRRYGKKRPLSREITLLIWSYAYVWNSYISNLLWNYF